MKDYYVHLENGEWQKVKGHKIKIEGFENLDIFYHKEGKYYHISEGKTGMEFVPESEKLSIAKVCAQNTLIKAKEKGVLDKAISRSIKQYGLSPRWREKDEQIQNKG
jgi:hypothetical protein